MGGGNKRRAGRNAIERRKLEVARRRMLRDAGVKEG